MGGEGEGEGAHDGGLDPALKVEELTRCHRARGAGRDEAGSARDIHGAHKVANGSGANAAAKGLGGDDEWDEVTFEEVAGRSLPRVWLSCPPRERGEDMGEDEVGRMDGAAGRAAGAWRPAPALALAWRVAVPAGAAVPVGRGGGVAILDTFLLYVNNSHALSATNGNARSKAPTQHIRSAHASRTSVVTQHRKGAAQACA